MVRQFTQDLNDKMNLVLPVVDCSGFNHMLLRYLGKQYVKRKDSLLYGYADGLRRAPERGEGSDVFYEWLSMRKSTTNVPWTVQAIMPGCGTWTLSVRGNSTI